MLNKYTVLMATVSGRISVDVYAENYLKAADKACDSVKGRPLEVKGKNGSATRYIAQNGYKWAVSVPEQKTVWNEEFPF